MTKVIIILLLVIILFAGWSCLVISEMSDIDRREFDDDYQWNNNKE